MSSSDNQLKVDLGEGSDSQPSTETKKPKKRSILQNFFSNNKYVYEIVNNFNYISVVNMTSNFRVGSPKISEFYSVKIVGHGR